VEANVRSEPAGAAEPGAVRDGIVLRRQLFGRLEGAGRVTQISAPAGSGKTVLLRSWIQDAGLADRAAWVAVRREDGGPRRFWTSVVDALRETTAGSKLVRTPADAPDPDGRPIVGQLLEDLGPLQDRLWLVLDDLHELRSAEAQRDLELFLMRAPSELRFVLATRSYPRLGLHRLRLDGELTELLAAELRFTHEEARTLLEAAGVALSDSALALLHERAEGWAAGLRLAALAVAGHPDPESFVAEFSGSERTVAGYLLAEVLDRQPARTRRLLLRTSVLERVNGELADLLTGGSGAERTLRDLATANAFVVEVDTRRSWFRYHPLFADLLRSQLRASAPGEVPGLHGAAADWLAEHGYPVEAVRHAQAAEDWGLAARVLSDHCLGFVVDGQAATAYEFLTRFPAQAVAADAELIALMAAGELDRGSVEEAKRLLALAADGSASVPEERRGRLEVLLTVLRLWLGPQRGDLPTVVEEAERLLTWAEAGDTFQPELDEDLRALMLTSLGIAELWSFRLEEAERHLGQGVDLARRRGRAYLEITALAYWAAVASPWSVGMAVERGMQAVKLARQHGWSDQPIAAVAYLALGTAAVCEGRLAEAEALLERADSTIPAQLQPGARMMLHVAYGLLDLARGHHEAALAAFRTAGSLAEQVGPARAWRTQIRALLLVTLVRSGEIQRAEQAFAELDADERETAQVRTALAALRLAQDDPQAATAALGPVVGGAAPAVSLRPWVTQAFLLEATARDRLGDRPVAERATEHALALAQPDGMLLPFLLHSAPGLLQRHARHSRSHAGLISQVLNLLAGQEPASPVGGVGGWVRGVRGGGAPPVEAAEPETPGHGRGGRGLIEPLSHSEIRVLRYLPTNLTAHEIAGQLYLSVHTVKTHIRHVYSKLGAHGRREAVERARAHGLLPSTSWAS
jgi:LuxR family transcriptional regulator, maltose regulon positive regulatory protein